MEQNNLIERVRRGLNPQRLAAIGASALAFAGTGIGLSRPTEAMAQAPNQTCITDAAGSVTCESSSGFDTSTDSEPAPVVPETVPSEPVPEPSQPSQSHHRPRHHRPAREWTEFYDFNQDDWGSRIAHTGCGPTALAMVVSTLDHKRTTPKTVADYLSPMYYIPGSGTTRGGLKAAAKHYNINEKQVDSLNGVAKAVKLGGLAIVHAKPGHFTGAGHYMVVKGFKDGKFKLADPNGAPGRDSERKSGWTGKQLRANGIDQFFTFSK